MPVLFCIWCMVSCPDQLVKVNRKLKKGARFRRSSSWPRGYKHSCLSDDSLDDWWWVFVTLHSYLLAGREPLKDRTADLPQEFIVPVSALAYIKLYFSTNWFHIALCTERLSYTVFCHYSDKSLTGMTVSAVVLWEWTASGNYSSPWERSCGV